MDAVTSPAIAVHIVELDIDGVDPVDRHALARGLERELVRLFTASGVPRGLLAGEPGRPPVVAGGPVTAFDVGQAVARALYEGWR